MHEAGAEGSTARGGLWLEASDQQLRADTKGGSPHRTKIQLSLLNPALSSGLFEGRGGRGLIALRAEVLSTRVALLLCLYPELGRETRSLLAPPVAGASVGQ